MITWLKRLLGVAPVESNKETLVLTNEMKVEETAKPKTTTTPKPKTTTKKPAPKKKEAAKVEPVDTKRGRKKTGITKTDIQKMNKVQLEAYAKKEFGVDLDRNSKKSDLTNEVLKLAKL